MHVYVFIETENQAPKKSSLSALAYGRALVNQYDSSSFTALVVGPLKRFDAIEKYGLSELICIGETAHTLPQAQAVALSEALPSEEALTLVMSHNLGNDLTAAHLSVIQSMSLATAVLSLPEEQAAGCLVKRGIYTGKAFEQVLLKGHRRVLCVRNNVIPSSVEAPQPSSPVLKQLAFSYEAPYSLKRIDQHQSKQSVPLPEAEIVVSGGRGMKGPANWHLIEEIADLLGAATACSKPVSDMEWRPHHEHVGQTGIKVAPHLYLAIGISGAVQHLAGVSNSNCIVVINNDPEAPFFQIATYGIIGDALDVLPRLKESIKSLCQ